MKTVILLFCVAVAFANDREKYKKNEEKYCSKVESDIFELTVE